MSLTLVFLLIGLSMCAIGSSRILTIRHIIVLISSTSSANHRRIVEQKRLHANARENNIIRIQNIILRPDIRIISLYDSACFTIDNHIFSLIIDIYNPMHFDAVELSWLH